MANDQLKLGKTHFFNEDEKSTANKNFIVKYFFSTPTR